MMQKNDTDPFYNACIQACKKLDKKKQFGTYAYNVLKDNGVVDHILNGNLSLDDYTNRDLKSFRGLGNTSCDILRVAWAIYTKKFDKIGQQALDLDPVVLKGYSTGNDIIRWIHDHKLENKRVYYAGHNCVGFIVATFEVDGMEYHTLGDIDVLNGNYLEFRDSITSF